MAQLYKGDDIEKKFYNAGRPECETLSAQKNDFFTDGYSCFKLGEILYDNDLSPLANSIPRDIFRESFSDVFEAFVDVGSFESYLTVFRSVFGDAVEVTFTVPAPGKLNIAIVATGLALYNIAVRTIVEDEIVIDDLIDDEGDYIVLQAVKGFESQYELEQMLYEMVPAGIYTQISLTVGS